MSADTVGPKGSAGWTGRTQSHTVWEMSSREQLGAGGSCSGGWASLFLGAQPLHDPPSPSNQLFGPRRRGYRFTQASQDPP